MLDSIRLALFFFFSLLLQIYVFQIAHLDFNFLKKGRDVRIAPNIFVPLILIFIACVGIIFYFLSRGGLTTLLYVNTCFFIFSLFLTLFCLVSIKKTSGRFILSISIAVALVCAVLLNGSVFLKNIVTAVSLLWVSLLIYKYWKIKTEYIYLFLVLFTLFDIYNVFLAHPILETVYVFVPLNGYVEFGRFALGMGDFFIGFLSVSLLLRERGKNVALLLAAISTVPLLILNSRHRIFDFPYSPCIVAPLFLVYYLTPVKEKVLYYF